MTPVVERIMAAVAEPMRYDGQDLHVTASVGVAFQRPEDDFDADELVRRADMAMYSVKNAGPGRVRGLRRRRRASVGG